MAQELINLPRFIAYAKVIEEKDGIQRVLKKQIKTQEVSRQFDPDIVEIVRNQGYSFSKKRPDIDAEIRNRQEKWRVVTPQTQSEPPEEPPAPPTKF